MVMTIMHYSYFVVAKFMALDGDNPADIGGVSAIFRNFAVRTLSE